MLVTLIYSVLNHVTLYCAEMKKSYVNIENWNVIKRFKLSLALCLELSVFSSSTTCRVVSWTWPIISHMDVTVQRGVPVTVLQPTRLTRHVNEIINVARAHRSIGQLVNCNRHTSSMAGRRTMSTALFVVSRLIEHLEAFNLILYEVIITNSSWIVSNETDEPQMLMTW